MNLAGLVLISSNLFDCVCMDVHTVEQYSSVDRTSVSYALSNVTCTFHVNFASRTQCSACFEIDIVYMYVEFQVGGEDGESCVLECVFVMDSAYCILLHPHLQVDLKAKMIEQIYK